MILLLFLSTFACFSLIFIYIKIKFSYWKQFNVPVVEPNFPCGSLKGVGTKIHVILLFDQIYRKLKEYGPIAGLYFFTQPAALIMDPKVIKDILVKDFNVFHDRGLFVNEKSDPLSGHLFSLGGEKWNRLRKKLSPTFTSGKMKMMFDTIADVSDQFKNYLEQQIDEPVNVEVKDLLSRFTTDIIGNCAFGIQCNSMLHPNSEFRNMGKKIFDTPKTKTLKFVFMSLFRGLSNLFRMKTTDDDVERFFLNLVKETIEYRRQNNVVQKDFMNLIMNLSSEFNANTENSIKVEQTTDINGNMNNDNMLSFEEITAQCFVFFIAGFESSSTLMTFILYELACNSEIQERLRGHILEELRKHNDKLTYDLTISIPYLDQVINESLRKYPALGSLSRIASKDYQIRNTNIVIRKGQFVNIPVYSIHHDEKYYSNPEKFDPDRFTKENVAKREPYTFLPFGAGPRSCIGLRFGLAQTRAGIITILSKFKISKCAETPEPIEFSAVSPVLASVGGMWLQMEKL
ncbi:probable cytochrome P450 6a13 [Culicoides brevitarsis]|uniref:probable cytochrome P450 6a13 n=1 Tax=Culicoides brevitarsis TaxID=469753 RepID=UPI00307BDB13